MTKDRRLIIEKGGYRPETSGPARPPIRSDKALHSGYRPTSAGPARPPVTRPTEPPTSGKS